MNKQNLDNKDSGFLTNAQEQPGEETGNPFRWNWNDIPVYKVSTYIAVLQKFMAEHGDLPVGTNFIDGSAKPVPSPILRFIRINNSRQSKVVSWNEYTDKPEQKGSQYCEI